MPRATTPLMQQYLSLKRNYPDYVLLFQMGDFYETFFDDAKEVSKALDIVLTSREKERQTPMAGFPIKAIDDYLPKLIKAGYKIAIADQIGDPAQAIGIVERGVKQLITPGTVVQDTALDQRRNNYIVALHYNGVTKGQWQRVGLAFADVSTGEFHLTELSSVSFEHLLELLHMLNPAEILVPDKGDYSALNTFRLQPLPAKLFRHDEQFSKLTKHFNVPNLDGFGVQNYPLGISAAGVILQYLQEQQTMPRHFTNVKLWLPHEYLLIDSVSNHNLGITSGAHSLYNTLDHCHTALGHRLLHRWLNRPSVSKPEIEGRLDSVAVLMQNDSVLYDIRDRLQAMSDLERLTARLGVQEIYPRHLQALQQTISQLFELRNAQSAILGKLPFLKLSTKEQAALQKMDATLREALLDNPGNDIHTGGIFRPEYHPEIATLRSLTADRNGTLEQIVAHEKTQYKIATIRIGYNRVFGYYLEVPHTHRDKVPPHYIRKQTLVNAERYITEELKKLEDEIITAEGRLAALELELYQKLIADLLIYIPALQKAASCIAQLDVLSTFAHLAQERQYARPNIEPAETQRIAITQGRHPVVELTTKDDFIPNDTLLNTSDHNLIILTGPNMAGKSTYIRQVALITVMAHIGSFVPAEHATISITDRIFARVGAGDDIATGRSTFMVEMSEAAHIINNATSHSLVILDELGRGTSTYDGLSLAWAISTYIRKHIQAKTILATHYHEMTSLANGDPGIKNYVTMVAESGDTVRFLRTVKPGKADKSYGIYVAQLVGLPKEIITEAKDLLHHLETHQGKITFIKQPALFGEKPKSENRNSKGDPRVREIEKLLKKVDINNITPLQAFALLEKVQKVVTEKTK